MGKWHHTDILGIHTTKKQSGSKDRPTGYGWTYKASDRDLERKEKSGKKKR